MPTKSPSPFRPGDDPAAEPTITSDEYGAVLVMMVHGSWNPRSLLRLSNTVRDCLAEHPSALIINLHHLDDPEAASAPLWVTAAQTAAALRPPVHLALSLPPATALAARSILVEHRRLALPPDRGSAGLARALVADACRSWQLPQLVYAARLVMSELVANAVEHAGTDLLASVARRGHGLYLVVRDGSVALPQLLQPAPGARPDRRGQGLRLVDEVASAWGAMRTHDGTGKVVWASVQPRRIQEP
jgi:anti-sigma regulatory factor (Ser/Thr protein kinase)